MPHMLAWHLTDVRPPRTVTTRFDQMLVPVILYDEQTGLR